MHRVKSFMILGKEMDHGFIVRKKKNTYMRMRKIGGKKIIVIRSVKMKMKLENMTSLR